VLHVHCDRLGKEVLIWPGSVQGIQNTEQGMVVTYRCACGDTAQMVTGKNARAELSAHVAA